MGSYTSGDDPVHSQLNRATGGGADSPPQQPPQPPPKPPPSKAPILDGASREIAKATLVPLTEQRSETGLVLVKSGFLRQLGLRADEATMLQPPEADAPDRTVQLASRSNDGGEPLATTPQLRELAKLPVSELRSLGDAVVELRQRHLDAAGPGQAEAAGEALRRAVGARDAFTLGTTQGPLGMLNLERLEMAPAGIERGELIATIPLAPMEETSVVQKEWSVLTKEFTSIVTDTLEDYSETGVTDNTELAQSTNSQSEHSNQFNVTGTVSGGIPVISGSATTGFTMQDANSQSAAQSRKDAKALTRKASRRSQQEHKVTISTTTVTGTEMATTRKVSNPHSDRALRIDYFSMMRKWRVRLYRYGLRLTYDITIPEPGAMLRKAYRDLHLLRAQLKPFTFNIRREDIRPDSYRAYADDYDVTVADPPLATGPLTFRGEAPSMGEGDRSYFMPVEIPPGYEVERITVAARIVPHDQDGKGTYAFGIVGSDFDRAGVKIKNIPPTSLGSPLGPYFLAGARGPQSIAMYFHDVIMALIEFIVHVKVTDDAMDRWRTEVWNALFEAANTRHYAQQQDIAGQIADIEDRLGRADTLTLRREESDEIMRGVIRFIAGHQYQYMSDAATEAYEAASKDGSGQSQFGYGIGFVLNNLKQVMTEAQYEAVLPHLDRVRFINQAIEWENVVTFLYSYIWDIPRSWDFVRQIHHPDANRQAFLRAGSARVVLTIRRGFEQQWLQFADSGFTNPDHHPGDYYLSIAKEIAAYDSMNYPGIPPANPDRDSVRLQDSVYATSTMKVGPSVDAVAVTVDSTKGFVAGDNVVIDSVDRRDSKGEVIQELQRLLSVDGPNRLTVAKLKHAHDGTNAPFAVVQPGERGTLIAEWNEYTPSSGTDIAIESDLDDIA